MNLKKITELNDEINKLKQRIKDKNDTKKTNEIQIESDKEMRSKMEILSNINQYETKMFGGDQADFCVLMEEEQQCDNKETVDNTLALHREMMEVSAFIHKRYKTVSPTNQIDPETSDYSDSSYEEHEKQEIAKLKWT